VGGRDFDNNGSQSTAYRRHAVTQAGGVIQRGFWGFGGAGLAQQYDVETAGVVRRHQFTSSTLVVGRRSQDGRFIWGGGLRLAEFSVMSKGSSHKLLTLSGAGVSAGALWRPAAFPLRFGASLQSRITEDPARSQAPGTVATMDGLNLPRGVTLPGVLSLGAAYSGEGPRHPVLVADLRMEGRVPEADGLEAFLEQKHQRSGHRSTVSPRVGGEAEVLPGRLRLRAGTYFEPARFTGVPGRVHGTGGFQLRLFRLPFFGGHELAFSYAVDAAPRYAAHFISLGFWH
jgi:hypothetical protein